MTKVCRKLKSMVNFKDSGVKSCKVSNVLKVYKMSKSFKNFKHEPEYKKFQKNFKHEPEFKNFKGSKSWSKCVKAKISKVKISKVSKSFKR